MLRESRIAAQQTKARGVRVALARFARQQSLVSLAGFGASFIALSALVPVLVRALGPKTYGAWVLTGGIVNYITLFDFGMSLTIARFVALAYKTNRREAEESIGVGLAAVGAIGLLAISIIMPLAHRWEQYLGVPGSAFALRTAAVALLFLLLSKVLQSALEGAGLVALSRMIQTGGTLTFTAAATVVAFGTSNKLEALSVVLLANSVAVVAAFWLFLMREWGWQIPLAVPDRGAFVRVARFALTMQGGSIVGFSVDPISRYILAAAAGPAAVTPLDIALRSASQWFGAGLAFARPILPELGHLAGADDVVAERAEVLWSRLIDVAVATGGYLALLAYFVFPLLFGHVGHYAGRLAAVGILLWTPSVIAIVPYLYIVLYGRARNVFAIQLVTSSTALVILLAFVWSFGAWAPVVGMGCGSLLGSMWTVRLARRRAGRGSFRFTRISPYAIAAPLAAGILFLMPMPLALDLAAATIVWAGLSIRPIRALFAAL